MEVDIDGLHDSAVPVFWYLGYRVCIS